MLSAIYVINTEPSKKPMYLQCTYLTFNPRRVVHNGQLKIITGIY